MKTCIFISYGHDEFIEKMRVIIKSLNGRKEYQTWWDGDMKKSADWVRQIENNLDVIHIEAILAKNHTQEFAGEPITSHIFSIYQERF